MVTMNTQAWIILGVVVVIVLIALAAYLLYQKKQSHRLEQRFGPEYGRAVKELGSRAKAETELKTREKRVEHLNIVPLAPAEADRFSQAWKLLQGNFVDNPKGVVVEADQLVRELLLKRGYPMGDFERRAADISVDHPAVVTHYRAAQVIAARDQRGEADTEELRKAVVHYRALFDELLEAGQDKPHLMPAKQMETQSRTSRQRKRVSPLQIWQPPRRHRSRDGKSTRSSRNPSSRTKTSMREARTSNSPRFSCRMRPSPSALAGTPSRSVLSMTRNRLCEKQTSWLPKS